MVVAGLPVTDPIPFLLFMIAPVLMLWLVWSILRDHSVIPRDLPERAEWSTRIKRTFAVGSRALSCRSMPAPMFRTPPFLRTTIALLLALGSSMAQADHLTGGTLTTECLGSNLHKVRLVLYRECSGAPMVPHSMLFSNDCGVVFSLNDLEPTLVEEVSSLCAANLANSTCNGGALLGVERYTYEQTVFLSPCNSWTVSWMACCRAASVNLLNSPGLYLETRFNNTNGACNASPVPREQLSPMVCVDRPVAFDAGATDPNGDVLRYRLIDARFGAPAPTPLNYVVPNYGGEPAPGMAIDTLTGLITFTPTQIGRVVTVVQVDEFRADGSYIGSVMHDFNFIVEACTNVPPDPNAGTVSDVNGAAELVVDDVLHVCSTGSFCATFTFTDPDAGQNLELSSNVSDILPGATLELNGTNPMTATLCWTAVELDPGDRVLSFTARDDACPIRAQQSYAIVVHLEAPPSAGGPGIATYCTLTTPFALVDSLVGAPSPGGTWTGPDGGSMNGLFSPGNTASGTYTYTTSLFPGCVATATVLALELPTDDPACILLGVDRAIGAEQPRVAQVGRELRISGLAQGPHHLRLLGTDGRLLNEDRMYVGPDVLVPLPESLTTGPILVRIMDGQGIQHALRVAIFR